MRTIALFSLVWMAVAQAQGTSGFVTAANGSLVLNQAPFRFAGSNSYALMLESHAAVDQVLTAAASNHFTTIRMWCFDEVANSSSSSFYLQSFSGGTPQFNDGANGLANVDYAVQKAGQFGIKLIVTLANNWTDYGGMDQYLTARGLAYHDQFFTDSTVRQWYKNWIAHVLKHVNTISGVAYKDDPAILMWELANEPRCQGSGKPSGLPSSITCNTQMLVSWIGDVAGYIKSIDANHLVAVGDEGFFCNSAGVPSSLNLCGSGLDSVAFGQAPNVDVIGFHLYPDTWIRDVAWADQFIAQHLASAKAAGKPVYMGEFGLLEGNVRNSAYQDFTNAILQGGGSGALFWDIVPGEPPAANAEALSSFDVQAGSPLLTTIGNFAQMMAAGQALSFPPVAGDQWAQGFFNAPVTLNPLGNDIAYSGAGIDPASLDLDPNTTGLQTSIAAYGGTFTVVGQSVKFVPSAGFNGTTQCAYTVADTKGNRSNTAYLNVTVAPSATATATLESFETGTDGWIANASSGAAGTVSQATTFHTDGSAALQVNVTGSGWFGTTLGSPADLSGRPSLAIDVQFSKAGQASIAFQSGSGSIWCQIANWPTVPANTNTTVTLAFDLSQLTCYGGTPTYSNITTVWVWLPQGTTTYLDNLRSAGATAPPPAPVLPVIGSVSNSASGQAGAGSGAYFSIYGSNFAAAKSGILTWSGWVVNGNLPSSLGGVSVTVGGQAAYIYAVSPTQINTLAPWLTAGSADVVVTTTTGNSVPFTVNTVTLQPAIFSWGKYAVATRVDYSYAVPNGTLSVATSAAKAGDVVVLWGTGFGKPAQTVAVGQQVPAAAFTVSNVSATLGSTPVPVYGNAAALAPGLAGVYQVAMTVPDTMASGTYDLVVTVNGVASPAVSFAVQ